MDRDALLARVKERFLSADQLSYVRSLQEVFGPDDAFLGDNVFETTFDRDSSTPPLVYEVSGPYDAASREYATVGRVYRGGALQWSGDIKPGILARTAAMVCLALDAVGHSPRRLLLVGPGKLGRETLSWMTERAPDLEMIGVRGRSPAPQALLAELVGRGVKAREDRSDGFAGYDCVVMTTNTDRLLLDAAGLETVERGAGRGRARSLRGGGGLHRARRRSFAPVHA